MNLESPKIKINKSQKELFSYLSEAKNFKTIMPDSLEKFEILSENTFLFQLKGMPVIQLVFKERQEFDKIILGADGGAFPFTFTASFVEIGTDQTEFQLLFEGEINAMMAMMVKKPINNFIQALTANFEKLMNQ